MSFTISSYNNSRDLNVLLKAYANRDNNLRFVIPSRRDKSYFPEFPNMILWTWQEIYDDIARNSNITRKRVLSPPDHLLILKSILSDVLNEYPEKIISLPGLTRPGFSSVLSDDIRELLNEAVRPEQLNHDPDSDEPSEFLLPEIYSRYLEYLNRNNLLDSAQIWTSAFEAMNVNQSWGKDLVLVFTGFMSFNHGQLELLHALEKRCREIVILKPEANLAKFYDTSSQFGIHTQKVKSSGKIIELPTAEPSLEPEAIARTLALWACNKWEYDKNFPGFDKIAIMISQGREDIFAEALQRYNIPYNFTRGITINLTLPGRVLSSIRNLHTRQFPTYDTAMLLTQSCFAGINFPVMWAYKAGYSGLDGWEKYLSSTCENSTNEAFSTALISIRAITKFCEALSRKNTPLGIMKAFHDFLTTKNLWLERTDRIYDFPELDENLRVTASAIQTVEEKVLALNELMPDLGPIQDKRFSNDEAYEFLEDWCRNSHVRAPMQISNAVRIFTGQPPVLAFFPVWIMTGVTQKTWSGNMTSSPLLGNIEREKLTLNDAYLPTTQDKAAQREALFRRLIMTGEDLSIILRPELDEEGRPVGETPFMQGFREDFSDWNITTSELMGINILLNDDGFIFPEIDAEEKKLRTIPAINHRARAIGASELNTIMNCPFLWWQKKCANLYEQNSDLTAPYEWGNMIHKFWECVWRRYRVDSGASGKIFVDIANDEWQKLLHASGNKDYEKFSRLVNDFRLRRHMNNIRFRVERLSRVQAGILDKLHNSGYTHRKILLEDEAHLRFRVNSITFLGQCDRIEILNDDEGREIAFIVDYKEGHSASSEHGIGKLSQKNYSWNVENRDKFNFGLQLSAYSAMFSESYSCKLSGVYILGLEDGKIAGSINDKVSNIFTDYSATDSNGKKLLNTHIMRRPDEGFYAMKCAAEILTRESFTPEYNSSDLCKWCSIKSLCRKGEFRGESLLQGERDNDNNE